MMKGQSQCLATQKLQAQKAEVQTDNNHKANCNLSLLQFGHLHFCIFSFWPFWLYFRISYTA